MRVNLWFSLISGKHCQGCCGLENVKIKHIWFQTLNIVQQLCQEEPIEWCHYRDSIHLKEHLGLIMLAGGKMDRWKKEKKDDRNNGWIMML